MTARPNVLLFVFDTLRADALSAYAADAAPTPNFDRVAERGTLFERAFSAGSWTPPAHGALFSGRYPSDTGFAGAWPSMPDDVPLLAERFADAGYDTFGVAGPSKMGSPVGLDRGFDRYYEVYEELPDRTSLAFLGRLLTDPLARRDLRRLALRGNDFYTELKFEKLRATLPALSAPWLTVANLTTVHAPYRVPKPFLREETPDVDRPALPLFEELFDRKPTVDHEGVRPERLTAAADGADATSVAMRYYEDGSYLADAELAVLRAWYRACVRYLDERLGRFLDWFESSGLADDTVLVLTSDHGEFFGEHRSLYHGRGLHDEVTHVPLLLAGPGVPAGERRSDLVSLVDLLPTLCELTGAPAPETAGAPLFAADHEPREAVFAEEAVSDESDAGAVDAVDPATVSAFEVGRQSVRTDDYRFERRSDGTERLYRLPGGDAVADPDESVVAPLRARLRETLGEEFVVDADVDGAAGGSESDREFSAGVERNLRELGYLE